MVQPEEIFITNIQNTHLENFKSKKNIAEEKSNIFKFKNNKIRRKNYILNIKNKSEKIIYNKSKKEKNLKIIQIDDISKKYFIKKIHKINYYQIIFQ